MKETSQELGWLQRLLDSSHARSTGHLRSIVDDDTRLTAPDVTDLMTGMRVLSLATVTAAGEPRISAVDGHFLHARWVFSTSGTAAKARHLRRQPAVSVACVEGEEVAVFTHGRVEFIEEAHVDFEEIHHHLVEHYGSSPFTWGEQIVLCRVDPTWCVGYSYQRASVLAARGVVRQQSAGEHLPDG
ncbi:MAG TPA: pyridoxamine 5'-phosphate oxidase family protein [Actinomycetales bacterium]|nr:pyridoxamine 5'-phosphate oxidase family protein [Actinomycetales bacterium]